MFGLASPRRRTSPRSPRRTTLGLEVLESRDCPSCLTLNLTPGTLRNVTLSGDLTGAANVANQVIDLGGQVPATQVRTDANGHYSATLQATGLGTITAQDDDGSSNVAMVFFDSPPPVIQNLNIYANNGMWTFSGQVVAPTIAGMTVTLDNGATLQSNPVTLRPDGTFAYSIQLNGAVDPGLTYTVTATDCWGQSTTVMSVIPD